LSSAIFRHQGSPACLQPSSDLSQKHSVPLYDDNLSPFIIRLSKYSFRLPGVSCSSKDNIMRFFVSSFFHQTTYAGSNRQAWKISNLVKNFMELFVFANDSPGVYSTPGSRLESLNFGYHFNHGFCCNFFTPVEGL
jgi:hypothetical protein